MDVAVIPINFRHLLDRSLRVAFFRSDEHAAVTSRMRELGITEGDFAYVLGFPMGIMSGKRSTVIARSGSIARVRDALSGASPIFLVDSFVFPGNSGGPVVSKPEALAIQGTKAQSAAYLIGVVQSYVPYQDVAVSLQTGRPRVVFEENSGLAAAHPIDAVEEAIGVHLKEAADEEGTAAA